MYIKAAQYLWKTCDVLLYITILLGYHIIIISISMLHWNYWLQ